MSGLHFQRPEWLVIGLIAVLWLALFYLQRRADGGWGKFVDAHLLPTLLSHKGKGNALAGAMLALLAALLAIAIAGPSLSQSEVPVDRDDRVRVFLLDMSRSMSATDLRPDRMTQARLKLIDLLKQSRDRQVALIGFAAYPYTLTPLTDDVNTVLLIAPMVETNMAPAQGADIDAALAHANEIVSQGYARNGDIVLISDSEPSQAAIERAAELADAGLHINVVAVGGSDAVPVPHGKGVLTDQSDQPVLAQPAHAQLQALARAGNGEYVALSSGAVAVESVLQSGAELSATQGDSSGTTTLWRDDGAWLLWLALIPIAVLARRGVLA
ncbi:MAG: VWA domain-containing protein [Pseudomonadota bacterium]